MTEKIRKFLSQQSHQIVFAYLFGSKAESGATLDGDIDLAVYFRQHEESTFHALRVELYAELSRILGTNDLDIVVLNSARNLMLLENIIRKGILLCDKNPPLREAFELRVLHQAIDFNLQRKLMMGI